MKMYLKYLWYVLRHKYFVFVAGRKLHVPIWQLLKHDMSKFSREEFGPYARYFMGTKNEETKAAFDEAWEHHKWHNLHHWDAPQWQQGNISMSDKFVKEMVADWMGAGRAITGKWEAKEWYVKNGPKMQLHPATRMQVEKLLGL